MVSRRSYRYRHLRLPERPALTIPLALAQSASSSKRGLTCHTRSLSIPSSIPTTIVSSQQLEGVIPALSDGVDCGTSLLGALASDPDVVKTSLDPLPLGGNQLLREIGAPWFDEHRLEEPEESDD